MNSLNPYAYRLVKIEGSTIVPGKQFAEEWTWKESKQGQGTEETDDRDAEASDEKGPPSSAAAVEQNMILILSRKTTSL